VSGHRGRAARRIVVQHVVHTLGDGGADRALTRVVTHADPHRVQHRILALTPGPGHAPLPTHVQLQTLDGERSVPAALQALLRSRGPAADVVHGWVSFPSVIAAACAAATGAALVLRQPTNIEQELRWNRGGLEPYWTELRAAFALADCVVVPSPVLADGTRRVYGVERIVAIPNAVECEAPARWDAAARRARSRIVLALVGRLVDQKNPLMLLHALKSIGDRLDWELRVYGDGPLRAPMDAIIEAEGWRDRVRFMGFRHDWRADVRAFDAFVFPTRFEGMSNCLLEAAAAGLPIVTTGIPENRFVLRSDEAIFVEPERTDDLAAAILRIAHGHELAALLGAAALRAPLRFTAAAMVRAHEQLYEELAQAHDARRAA
jgi:glycosyltransferase involved in cell wall biosynthesis